VTPPQAAILTIGSELTTGRVADTNGQWAAARLSESGWDVTLMLSVDDDVAAIGAALRIAAEGRRLVWVTGGLGPTRDDLTVDAVAAALGVEVREDDAAAGWIRARLARAGRPVSAYALRMARIPAGAEALPNPVGVAPGAWLEAGGTAYLLLPGVPAEMRAIAERHVLPRLRAMASGGFRRAYRILGLTEGEVDQAVRDLWDGATPGVRFALQIADGEVVLRLTGNEAVRDDCEALDQVVRDRLGAAVYALDDESLERHVVRRLAESGRTCAVAESLTAGAIAARLASVPGASRVLAGGWIAYTDAAKAAWLGVPRDVIEGCGAVSTPAAAAMAEGARRLSGADVAVSATGWAGPDGGTADDPVGTVYFGAASAAGVVTERRQFRGGRDQIRAYAVTFALDLLRRSL
jgi:nicotinamide-nucleotide amidase